jgi:hypothetical protein
MEADIGVLSRSITRGAENLSSNLATSKPFRMVTRSETKQELLGLGNSRKIERHAYTLMIRQPEKKYKGAIPGVSGPKPFRTTTTYNCLPTIFSKWPVGLLRACHPPLLAHHIP